MKEILELVAAAQDAVARAGYVFGVSADYWQGLNEAREGHEMAQAAALLLQQELAAEAAAKAATAA